MTPPHSDPASSYTHDEVVRWLKRNDERLQELANRTEGSIDALATEIKAARHDLVLREVYEADQRARDDRMKEITAALVDLQAEQARVRREMAERDEQLREDAREEVATLRTEVRAGQRWAITALISTAGVLVAGLAYVTNALGLGA